MTGRVESLSELFISLPSEILPFAGLRSAFFLLAILFFGVSLHDAGFLLSLRPMRFLYEL